jgi:hypothetical protein
MSIAEASQGALSQLSAALRLGQGVLNYAPTDFRAYTRVVLPLDRFIFWQPTVPLIIAGSLHYSQELLQNEDETFGQATVIFTTSERIAQFEEAPINTIFLSRAGNFRFAFAQQQGFYSEANLYHYLGHSIPPSMESQFLDTPRTIDPSQAVVSNSLPLWLKLNNYQSLLPGGFSNSLELFPSFIVAPNQKPPYISVHIGDDDTRALAAAPHLGTDRSHFQLVSDKVRVTLYGVQNNQALDFVDCVYQYVLETNNFGIMNMPVVRDAKRTLAEIQALAMKKVIDFEISYHQRRVADVSRQLIEQASTTFTFEESAI